MFHRGSNRSDRPSRSLAAAVCALCFSCPAIAATGPAAPLVVVRPAAESGEDRRFAYYWELLDQALKVTEPDFGPYELRATPGTLDQQRALTDLAGDTGVIDILVHGNVSEYEERLLPIPVPLDKGLLGYRVFLIRADMQPLFDRVNSIDDLRRYRIGQGRGWGDIAILRHAGLDVVEGGGYSGLFRMLASGRFDLLSRSVTEVLDELANNRGLAPPLAIESHLLLHYRLTRLFYVSRTARGERLAARVAAGLDRMQHDGSFARLFGAYVAPIEKSVGFRGRLLLKIDDPLTESSPPPLRKDLWYDPLTGL